MRIGVVTTSFPRAENDYAGRFVLEFCKALAARGYSIDVVAPEPRELCPKPAWPSIDVKWIPYLRPRSFQTSFYDVGVLDNIRRNRAAWLGLPPFIASMFFHCRVWAQRWDAIISHWCVPSALIAGLVRAQRPHLAVCHSADIYALERLPCSSLWAARIAKQASALVFASNAGRERYLSLLKPRERCSIESSTAVMPMGITTPHRPPDRVRTRARLGVNAFTCLTMSRLIPIKGIEFAIKATRTCPNIELIIAGEGPHRKSLHIQAKESHVHVRFIGSIYGDLKHDWLSAADIFVAPSVEHHGRTEGAPHSILEALSYGLPIVASDTGGIRDIVIDGYNGLLVPPGDVGALNAAVARLQRDALLLNLLRQNARESVRDYEWSTLAPRIELLLRS